MTPASRATSASGSAAAFRSAGNAGSAAAPNAASAAAEALRTLTSGSSSPAVSTRTGFGRLFVDDPEIGGGNGTDAGVGIFHTLHQQRQDGTAVERRTLLQLANRSECFAPHHRVVARE